MKKLYCFLLLAFLIAYSFEVRGQMSRKVIKKNNKRIATYKGKKYGFGKEKRYNSLSLSLHALNYYGDLAPKPSPFSTDISFTRPAFGFAYTKRLGPNLALTAGFMYGTLQGSDVSSADENDAMNGKYRYNRNLSFRNRIKELSVVASYDLYKNEATYLDRVNWTPFVFAGITLFHHNPQALAPAMDLNNQPLSEAGKWVNLRKIGTEGQYSDLLPTDANSGLKPYNLIQLAIPMGIGVRFKLNEVLDLSAEIGFRYLFTDYIDDVSRNYVDLGVFNTELARALSYRSNELTKPDILRMPVTARNGVTYDLITGYGQEHPTFNRGNKKDKDIFMVTTFRLTYILGKNFNRAKFR